MWLRLTKSVVKVNKTCSRRNVVKVNNRRDGNEDSGGLWGRKLLDVAIEACDYTKGKPRHSWWCNRDVGASAWRQKDLFRIWRHSQKEEDKKNTVIKGTKRITLNCIKGYGSGSSRDSGKCGFPP